MAKYVDSSELDRIIQMTIDAVESGQREIYSIYEYTQNECDRIRAEIEKVSCQVRETIRRVEELEKLDRSARARLLVVSRDLHTYDEKDIEEAYNHSRDLQIKLYLERERELHLKEKRNDLERNYRGLKKILDQAENVSMQMGVAISFLRGNMEGGGLDFTDKKQKHLLAGRIITSIEEERRRMAREIHDGAAQTIANSIIQAEICERLIDGDPKAAVKELRELKDLIRSCLGELRTIIFNLRPPALDDLGLEAVVGSYCTQFQENTGIFTDFKVIGHPRRTDPNTEVTLFRIIQEALTNVKRHSQAKNVVIRYEVIDDQMTMIIADDGIGFESNTLSELKEKGHFGLLNIRERVELLNGKLTIETSKGRGTKLKITFPLKEH